MKPNSFLPGLALALAAVCAHAHEYQLGRIFIGHPYAHATGPGQTTGEGFLKLKNDGKDDRLLSASASVSRSVELHSMTMEGDVMHMREVDSVDLLSGKTVEFKPGGFHIMFVGLKAPLKIAERFPMKLKFAKAGEVTVEVIVQAVGTGAHQH